jgi:mono/diheme cytochrome c family protein
MRRLPHSFLAVGLLALPLSARVHADEKVQFNRDVRPIFSDTCFQCHGPDEKKRKAGLRLDTRDTAVKPAESGAIAIVPGKPDESELIKRLSATDPDDVMPPPRLHKKITSEQVATLKKWIAQGAEYQGHWAFIKPQRPSVPKLAEINLPDANWKNAADGHGDWSANPVDAFLLKNMAAKGLVPSREATPETIIRRMSLDLTGLPPTPAEVDTFVKEYTGSGAGKDKETGGQADKEKSIATNISLSPSPLVPLSSPNAKKAINHLADRLLASPHYGERMAVQWLDFARYADSNGFQTDTSRQMCTGAIGSSTPSIATCPSTSSPSSNSRAICSPTPRAIKWSPAVSSATDASTAKEDASSRNGSPRR